jgi:hypothetical protein
MTKEWEGHCPTRPISHLFGCWTHGRLRIGSKRPSTGNQGNSVFQTASESNPQRKRGRTAKVLARPCLRCGLLLPDSTHIETLSCPGARGQTLVPQPARRRIEVEEALLAS